MMENINVLAKQTWYQAHLVMRMLSRAHPDAKPCPQSHDLSVKAQLIGLYSFIGDRCLAFYCIRCFVFLICRFWLWERWWESRKVLSWSVWWKKKTEYGKTCTPDFIFSTKRIKLYPSVCPSICPKTHPSVHPTICPYVHPSICSFFSSIFNAILKSKLKWLS